MYKVFFDSRLISLSMEPDRTQKYCLFHRFDNIQDLYGTLILFENDHSIPSVNIYCNDIKHLWKSFRGFFKQVDAAGGLVRHSSGSYLIITRKGMADLPKGHTEKDESYPDCAIREVTEECGINGMKINSELETTYHSYRLHGERVLKSTHWYLMDYNGDMEGSPQTNEGISALNWMKPDELRLIRNKIWPSLAKLVDFAVKSR